MTDKLVISPQYPAQQPVYGKQITELYSLFELIYDDDTVSTTVELQEDTLAPPWIEPPDLLLRPVFPKPSATYANDPTGGNPWTRSQSIFSSTGADVDDVEKLSWKQGIAPMDSVQALKLTNPMPHTTKVTIAGADSSWDVDYDEWAPLTYNLGPGKFKEYDVRSYVRSLIDAEAYGILIESTLYDENLGDNGIEKLSGGTGFYLTYPDNDPKFMIPQAMTLSVDMANIIDQYGPLISGIAALGSGAAVLIPGLMESSAIKKFASAFSVSVAELAAIYSLGIQNQWVNTRTIAENMALAGLGLGTAGAAGAISVVGGYLPSKYGNMIGAALAGGATMGGTLAMLQMIDNCTVYAEW